jgi:Fe2+ or Zn2+ uptake regulation protein
MLTKDDFNKLQNRNLLGEERRDAIINFLKNHPGCTKEDVIRGVKDSSSKKTVQNILNKLKEEELITIEKEKNNSRGYKLFLCNDNILIAHSQQIKDFNHEFTKLLAKIEAIIPDLILLPFTSKENIDKNFIKILYYEQLPLFILKYLMQCLFLKSIIIWPKIIQKEEIRNKLTSLAFSEISKIISNYSNFYNNKLSKDNIHQVNYNPNIPDELNKLENNIIFFALFLVSCKKIGIDEEYENVVDKIWLINSDVQIYLHPEAMRYNLEYNYWKDNWRKYLDLYKEHIVRIEKEEKNKKQKLFNLISNLNVRNSF